MQIVPVIDLMNGRVVRGVAGRRDQYRPVQSTIADNAEPATVARALVEKLAADEVYVADLDAIGGAEPAGEVYDQIARCGPRLWVDAGLSTVDRARRLASLRCGERPLAGVIVGLESVDGPESLQSLFDVVGPERFIFSLDLKAGVPLTSSPAWQDYTPERIARLVLDLGVRRLIVLDLARVGMDGGTGTETLCRQCRRHCDDLQLIGGGGVRSFDDLRSLADAGCTAALVASALHDGRLTREHIEAARSL